MDRPILSEHEAHYNGVTCAEVCGRREMVRYRCVGCHEVWDVAGRYVWAPQGQGHFHEADMGKRVFSALMLAHSFSHEDAFMDPVRR